MKPHRIQLRRAKGWRIPPNTVAITRPHRWGNRFRVGDTVRTLAGREVLVRTAVQAVRMHRMELLHYLKQHPELLEELRGKNVACFCGLDQPCHGDTLLELANR